MTSSIRRSATSLYFRKFQDCANERRRYHRILQAAREICHSLNGQVARDTSAQIRRMLHDDACKQDAIKNYVRNLLRMRSLREFIRKLPK